MCGSMVDMQSATAKNRQGKTKEEATTPKYNGHAKKFVSTDDMYYTNDTLDRLYDVLLPLQSDHGMQP